MASVSARVIGGIRSCGFLLCRQEWLVKGRVLLPAKWRHLSLGPDPPSSSSSDDEGGEGLTPPEYETGLLEETGSVKTERPHYKTSILGDETLQNVPEYNVKVLEDASPGEYEEPKMNKLDDYEIECDERDMLQYRTNRTDNLEELENLPIIHVHCSYNNTYINICDKNGQIRGWKSCGSEGYKNTRKGTSVAAQATAQAAAVKAHEFGYHRVRVRLKGPGAGRQYSLKGFQLGGLQIASIQDVTPVPHNGCKPKKKRRI